jgi:hypothetical protein
MNTAQQMAMRLIKKQLTLMCIKIAENPKFNVTGNQLSIFMGKYFKTMKLNILQEEKQEVRRIIKSNKKSKCQCLARTGADNGLGQCKRYALLGKEFCNKHQNQYDECPEPCSYEEGTLLTTSKIEKHARRGLFLGRIDEPLEKAVVCKNNIIRVNWWMNFELSNLITDKVVSGEWEFQYGCGNRKQMWINKSMKEWKAYRDSKYRPEQLKRDIDNALSVAL